MEQWGGGRGGVGSEQLHIGRCGWVSCAEETRWLDLFPVAVLRLNFVCLGFLRARGFWEG